MERTHLRIVGQSAPATILPFRRPLSDSERYDAAVAEQQGDPHAISVMSARPLECDCAERVQAVADDERRDRYARVWQPRVKVACIALFYIVLGYFSFRIGSAL